MNHGPNRGEHLFRKLISQPIFSTLDFVSVNNDFSVSFRRGHCDIRVKETRVEGNAWVYDAWMTEAGNETLSQRSYIMDELVQFVEDAYAFIETTTI
jgi:hypothetical protein